MARRKTHPAVQFVVENSSGKEQRFRTFDEAAGFAVSLAASDGRVHAIDVLIYSVSGARWWGGDDAVEQYKEDPDASVSDRIEVRVELVGRVY